MNALHQIYQIGVYCALFALAGLMLATGLLLLFRTARHKCNVLLRTVPKSSLLAMIGFSAVATIHAQKVYVDPSVKRSGEGTRESPYKNFEDAFLDLSTCTSRLSIALAPGIYPPLRLKEVPVGGDGNPISVSIATYQREGEEGVESAAWIIDGKLDADGGTEAFAVSVPRCASVTNYLTGVTVRNAANGVRNFCVRSCIVSNCHSIALADCRASGCVISDSGVGLDGGHAISSTFTRCMDIALRNADAEFCYITNNTALAVSGGSVDTCLIENNGAGVTNATVYSSSILSNRAGGILGHVTAYNTLIAFNMDGDGRLCNFVDVGVSMTNCCTAPLPSVGTNNHYSALPVYPGTYRLPRNSPVFRNGSTNYLNFTVDLLGKARRKNGVTDIGAFVYADSDGTLPTAPKSWWRDRVVAYVEKLIEEKRWTIASREWQNMEDNVVNIVTLKSDASMEYFIPYSWRYGGTYFFEYTDIMNFKSGKKAADGKDITWWDEYVVGTDPLVADDCFRLDIQVSEGLPQLTWSPDLGEERIYLVFGKKELTDEWIYIQDGNLTPYRFFKIEIDLP